MKIKFLIVIITIAIISICVVLAISKNNKIKVEKTEEIYPKVVKIEQIKFSQLSSNLSYPGVASASKKANLFFRVSGPVVKVNVKVGKKVKNGDILMEIDPRDFKLRVLQLESQIKAAEARLNAMKNGAREEDIKILEKNIDAARSQMEKTKLDNDRYLALYKDKVVSKYVYEQMKNSYTISEAEWEALKVQLEKAKAGARKEDILAVEAEIEGLKVSLEIAKNQLADTKLIAPFDGIITKQLLENYEMAQAGVPVLCMHDISIIEVSVSIPESNMKNLSSSNQYLVVFDILREKKYSASLYEYNTEADDLTRTYQMTFRLNQTSDILILPGMTSEVYGFEANKNSDFLSIPSDALFDVENGEGNIWVVDFEKCEAVKRSVKVGKYLNENRILLKSGANENEWIISAGVHFIREGEKLKLPKKAS